jgi:tRNA 2-thiouridine synthesizing protein A
MSDIVDARGLSCPQPVLMVLNRIKELESGAVEVLLDSEVSRENVKRAAGSAGWAVDEKQETDSFRLILRK